MRTDLFNFDLPEDRIALRPVEPRDAARLLVVDPAAQRSFADHTVRDLPTLLRPGDALVFNNTRVIPAALDGVRRRGSSEARIHANLHKRLDAAHWRAFVRPARKLDVGERIVFTLPQGLPGSELAATVISKQSGGEVTLAFEPSGAALDQAIAQIGHMPLPPYIASRRPPDSQDHDAYQTVYASQDGAVAAPTAGLHFTDTLLATLNAAGLHRHLITLHVGAGTFLPVKADEVAHHTMHAEWGVVDAAVAQSLNDVRVSGGRIIAVGTTVARLLESAANDDGTIAAFSGDTDIFMTPGYQFRAIDGLMTNFHLPKSTLFMLVAAFSGLDVMQRAYAHAIAKNYRFYSYGDATLLFPAHQ